MALELYGVAQKAKSGIDAPMGWEMIRFGLGNPVLTLFCCNVRIGFEMF